MSRPTGDGWGADDRGADSTRPAKPRECPGEHPRVQGHRADVTRALLAALTAEKGRPYANLGLHLEVLDEAARNDCEVAVFPEFSLTGSVDPGRHPEWLLPVRDDTVRMLTAATGRTKVGAVFGIGEMADDGPYITQLYAEGGRLRSRHRKRHLGEDEQGYRIGDETNVFETAGRRAGVVICAEGGVDFTWKAIAAQRGSLVFFCSAPGLHGRRTDEASWRAGFAWWEECGLGDARRHAVEQQTWVAMATQAGSTFDEDFPGLAALVAPTGEVVARSPDWLPNNLIVDIPSDTAD